MDYFMSLKIICIIIVFLLGLYYVTNYSHQNIFESFNNKESYQCPNMLFRRGENYFLYNSNLAKVPGVNPIQFKTLEEYTEFVEWQKGQGIKCPVLYLEYSYDTQGNEVYKTRTSPFNQANILLPNQYQGLHPDGISDLLDANRDQKPFNQDNPPGFDQDDQYIGLETPLDKIYHSKDPTSANPMDPNWGGNEFTKKAVKSGKYKGDEVFLEVA
jgi:hypothetical protein